MGVEITNQYTQSVYEVFLALQVSPNGIMSEANNPSPKGELICEANNPPKPKAFHLIAIKHLRNASAHFYQNVTACKQKNS